MTNYTMSSSSAQDDTEKGQGEPLVLSLEYDSIQVPQTATSLLRQDKKNIEPHSRSVAGCAFAALIVAGATISYASPKQSLPQEHRRLSPSPPTPSRRLSFASRVFSVIADFSEADEVGFGIANDMEEEGQCPGQDRYKSLYQEIPTIWTADLGLFGIDEFEGSGLERTFFVEPNHTVLEDGSGVMFNVEVVPEARPEDARMTRLTDEDILRAVQEEAKEFYGLEGSTKAYPFIEAMSRMPAETEQQEENGGGTVFVSGQGFLAACMTAFAYHLPLRLSPDDLWIVIANGFARHIDHHAEELRTNFVPHEGQKEIRIREDSMVKGVSPPEQWEELVFPQFSQGIAENINNSDVYETMVVQDFTTSTTASLAASEVILMATMKNYFKYRMDTMCGIPNVRLDGTRADWEMLRTRTKSLAQWMLQNNTHGDLWIYDMVLPIIDEFLLSYDGEPNYCFWQNMIKFRTSGMGSGSYDFLSGWLHTLFPYLSAESGTDRPNPYLRPWLQSASGHYLGPKPNEIPIQMSSVPVQWNYYEQELSMHFHAGFRGVHQEADGTVRPIIGWYVTEDPAS